MDRIAWGRVLLGGLVAGVIWWITEGLVHGIVLGREWEASLMAMGRTKEQMEANHGFFLTLVTLWSLLAGVLGVGLYAAIRPRFGPGPKTAMIAGIALWLMIYLLPTILDCAFALWPVNLLLVPLATSFFESIIATLVGARIYKEA